MNIISTLILVWYNSTYAHALTLNKPPNNPQIEVNKTHESNRINVCHRIKIIFYLFKKDWSSNFYYRIRKNFKTLWKIFRLFVQNFIWVLSDFWVKKTNRIFDFFIEASILSDRRLKNIRALFFIFCWFFKKYYENFS